MPATLQGVTPAAAAAKTDKVRRKSHLPRDSQSFIRTPWLENFFETLYASNEPGIHIPYTVVFQYRRIYAAYYTDSEGYVQKVDKIADLAPENVIAGVRQLNHDGRSLGSHPNVPAGCRAYYVYSKKSEESFPVGEKNSDLSVEYFDDDSLTNFLTYRGKENSGLLQQFQEMTTPSVATIRAYWTEYYCQLETRMNLHRADDEHVPLVERAVTFDGELHHSTPYPLSSRLESRIKTVIGQIVGHVKESLPNNVSIQLMELNFRLGHKGRIWFLYCSTLKLYDTTLEFLGYGRDSEGLRPTSAKLVEASIPPPGLRGSKKRRGLVCPSSEVRLGPFDKYRVSVQKIFVHFLWHGPKEAWALLGRQVPTIPLEYGKDPGLPSDTLRFLLTMDLRPSPAGKPFIWNGLIDSKTLKGLANGQADAARGKSKGCPYQCLAHDPSTTESKASHLEIEKKLDMLYLAKPHLKAAYRYWKATMVYLISQEIETLTQENFRQERKRPLFLTAEINCCERAMLAYEQTYEDMLEIERAKLILAKPFSNNPKVPWARLGLQPKVLVHEYGGTPPPAQLLSAREPRRRKMEHSGSLSARSPRQRPDVMQLPEPEEERREQAQAQNAVPPKTEASTKTAASNGDRGTMIPGLSLLPPAPTDWLQPAARSLPSSRIAQKMLSTVQGLGGPLLDPTQTDKHRSGPRGLKAKGGTVLPSVVVDGNLFRQMKEQSLIFT